jgi:hypothetical protein
MMGSWERMKQQRNVTQQRRGMCGVWIGAFECVGYEMMNGELYKQIEQEDNDWIGP